MGAGQTDDVTRAINSLGDKLAEFLVAQPEWLYVLTQDRSARKRLGRMVGQRLTRIPKVGDDE